jgi:hypothetical protein
VLQEKLPPVMTSPASPVTAVEEHTITIVSALIGVLKYSLLLQSVYVYKSVPAVSLDIV